MNIPELYHETPNSLITFLSASSVSSTMQDIHLRNSMCFLPYCRYHNILIGNIKELPQKMDAFCFNYQHVDCLNTLFKYRSRGKVVVKSGQLFVNLQRVVLFNQPNRRVDRMLSIAKKRFLRKKSKKLLLSSFQKTKST